MPKTAWEILEIYQSLGRTEETLEQGMRRISGQLFNDLIRIEYYREWNNMTDGGSPPNVSILDLMRTVLGIPV